MQQGHSLRPRLCLQEGEDMLPLSMAPMVTWCTRKTAKRATTCRGMIVYVSFILCLLYVLGVCKLIKKA
jgi:hypothetical protein